MSCDRHYRPAAAGALGPTILLYAALAGAAPVIPGDGLPLHLQGQSFDPVRTPPGRLVAGTGLSKRTPAPRKTDYYLVQFNGPIETADKRAVTHLGAVLLSYVPDFAFVARMPVGAADAAGSLPQVRWVGLYQPAFRLERGLYDKHVRAAGLGITEELELDILVFRGEDVRGVANAVRAVGGDVRRISETHWRGKIRAVLNSGRLTALAKIPGISWIERAPDWQLHNEVATTDPVMDVEDVWTTGYTGATQTVAIADTHLDTGDSATYVDDFRECSGTTPRVSISQLDNGDSPAPETSDTSGHGTHVAGSVLGNGRLDGSTCGNYTGHPAGSAPEADGYFQAILDQDGGLDEIPDDLNNLYQPAHDFGARIHTNSWGSAVMGAYTGNSQEADQFSWDNKDMLILYSAGNSGRDIDSDGVIDLGSIGAPATAKNVLTVGASENPGQGSGSWGTWYTPVAPLNGDPYSDDLNGLAAFSSRGPTDDGRTKPDVVAPGIFVNSVLSTQVNQPGPPADYDLLGGTSMSTPLTAGAAAVGREAFTALEGSAPSAAMLKALLANGATNMAPGQFGTGATQEIPDVRPTMQAGWGRLDLEDSLFPAHDVAWWDETSGLATDESATYEFEVTSSATPLSATLAWTDWPGDPATAGGLVNDLDLKLEGPIGTEYPNNPGQRESSELLDPGNAWFDVVPVANGEKRATLLSPSSFPAQPALTKIWFYKASSGSAGDVTIDIVLYDDDGAGGAPGTILCTLSGARAAWGGSTGVYPVVLSLESCPAITNSEGAFFLAVEFTSSPSSTINFIYADSGPHASWYDTGSGWAQESSRVYSFAAVVYRDVSPASSFDRINNLVGIDLESPATGTYTLTVSGYNVPFGSPQPYALALSGSFTLGSTTTASDLAVTKTNDDDYAEIGGSTTYTVSVSNNGPDGVTGATVSDSLPPELTCDWTCTAGGGGSCTAGPVAGDISDSVDLPSGATATYTLACDIDGGASGTLSNTATASVPTGVTDNDPANNAASDSEPLTTCGEANDLTLSSQTVNDAQTFTACQTLHAGDAFVTGATGAVTLEAGESVSFGPGSGVATGGTLAVNLDPALAGN